MNTKIIILLVGFLDILSIGIFVPTMPELAIYFGVSSHSISYAIVLYALFSFLAAPALGQLSDRFGRKVILALCVLGTFFSSLLMSLTSIFWIFLLARIINGITGGNIAVLQSMLSDISKDKADRMQNMGMIGALFGMGFIVGPIIGALLLPLSIKAPFYFMTGLSLMELFVVALFLKETNTKLVHKRISWQPFGTIFKYLNTSGVNLFLISYGILMLSFSMFQGMFPVFLNQEFGVPGRYAGFVMSGVGLLMALNQAFLLKHFWLKHFSLKILFVMVNGAIFIAYSLLSIIHFLPVFLAIFYAMILFVGPVAPIYSSEIVSATHENDRGEIMGVLGSLQSVTMFVGPLIAGMLIDAKISIFLGGVVIILFNLGLIGRIYKHLK